jgi:hypothetical protein
MTTIALGAIVFSFVNFLKYLRGRDWNAAGTQLIVWISGITACLLASQAEIAAGLEVPGTTFTLGALDFGSLVLVGLQASSLFTFGNEVKKAIDNTDNAKTPKLLRRV